MNVKCKEFWYDTGKRCAWTFAQAMLGCIAVGQTITEIAWKHAFSIAIVATIACFLKQVMVYTEEDKTAAKISNEMKALREDITSEAVPTGIAEDKAELLKRLDGAIEFLTKASKGQMP